MGPRVVFSTTALHARARGSVPGLGGLKETKMDGEETIFQTAETGNRTPDSGVKGSGANHYPRAPAQVA